MQACSAVHRVPLAHEEVVALLRPRVVEAQEMEEQRRHDVGARHRAAEVRESTSTPAPGCAGAAPWRAA